MSVTALLEHVGPVPEKFIRVPPVSVGNADYALIFDEQAKRLVYVRNSDYHEWEAWEFDGTAWNKRGPTLGVELESSERYGYWDSSQDAVVVWSVRYDDERSRHVPLGVLMGEKSSRELSTKGDPPVLEPAGKEHFYLSSNIGMLMTYDADRRVGVCLTRSGVYEIDASLTWTRKGDLGSALKAEWHSEGSGAWDPVGKRCVFWLQDRDHYDAHFYAWDGSKLSRLPDEGLPKLKMGLSNPCFAMAGHTKRGVVVCVAGELYALGESRWTALPATKNPPPRMKESHLAYDPAHDVLMLGPGRYEGDPGGHDAHAVFYALHDSAWTKQGVARPASPVGDLNDNPFHAVSSGTWVATSRWLQTMEWTEKGWKEIVDKESGQAALGKERLGGIAGAPEGLVAVTQKGHVLRLTQGAKAGWKLAAKAGGAWKERSGFHLVYDAASSRLVAWGGEVKNRRSNDTMFWDGKSWTQAKTSPQPKDLFAKGYYVDFTLFFDPGLGRVVRLSKSDAAVLEGEQWVSYAPKGYAKLVGGRSWEHVPVTDATTGEVLLVDIQSRTIVRFDLTECALVGTFEYPAHVLAEAEREREALFGFFRSHLVANPATRSLEMQYPKDTYVRFSLALGPCFEAAKKLRPRKLLGAPSAAAPAKSEKVWLYKVTAKEVKSVQCKADDKILATKKKEGFLPASALTPAMLERLAAKRSSALHLGKKLKGGEGLAESRLGGLPCGVTLAKWPKKGKTPMGFLFQLRTGDLLQKHAGVAVFCVTDGTATEDDDRNAAVLLTLADLKRGPVEAAPEGVPVLPPQAIVVKDPLPELDEEAAQALSAKDPAIAEAFERYQSKAKVQEANLSNKLGGNPLMLQDGDLPRKLTFVAQLDFDGIRLEKPWKDAGLAGCIYVAVTKDEKSAAAFWQYT